MSETSIGSLAAGAMEKGTFSVLDAAKNRSYPTKVIEVYTDADAALRLAELDTTFARYADDDDVKVLADDAEYKELVARHNASVLKFTMRGFGEGVVRGITAKVRAQFPAPHERDNPTDEDIRNVDNERFNWFVYNSVAEHILSVQNADGAVDDHHWTPEEAQALQDTLPKGAWEALVEATNTLTFEAIYFDQAVSADFS